MPLHLLKLAVGCDTLDELRRYQNARLLRGEPVVHRTRNYPRRADEILAGGSLYWVIKGSIRARQVIAGITGGGDGESGCVLHLGAEVHPTVPTPWRPFQGWRYMEAEKAPADLPPGMSDETDEMPPALVKELKQLGLT